MKITIVGGGNIGTQFAVNCAQKGHEVTIFTSSPECFQKHLMDVDSEGNLLHEGEICCATSDPKLAFEEAELIMVTYPPSLMKEIAEIIYSYAGPKAWIGVVPGNGGCECAFRKCIERGNVFFGLERVPGIARLVEKGKTVMTTGYKSEIHVASMPARHAEAIARLIESIFDIKTVVIPHFLNLTLTPSNPILHTSRLRVLFQNWHEGVVYERVPLFYEEWDDASSELLIACDNEVQSICHKLNEFPLEYVLSLQVYYESPTVEAMTKKIRSIKAFRGLTAPTVSVDGGLIPDLQSRYFTADFPFGLKVIQQMGRLAGVPIPNIDANMDWYSGIAKSGPMFDYSEYGIENLKQFLEFYHM